MSKEANDFWSGLVDIHGKQLSAARPTTELVGAVQNVGSVSTLQTYKRGDTHDSDSEKMPRLSRNLPAIGDVVVIQTLADGSRVVLGKLYESNEDEAEFNRLTVHANSAGDTALFQIYDSTGVEQLNYRQDDKFLRIFRGNALRMYLTDNSTYTIDLNPDYVSSGRGRIAADDLNINSIIADGQTVMPSCADILDTRWSGPEVAIGVSGSSTFSMAANRSYAVPWIAPKTGTLTSIGAEVTTLQASSGIRFAFYDSDSLGYPSTRLDTLSIISTTTVGVKSAAISIPVIAGNVYHLVAGVTVANVAIRSFSPARSYYGQATAGGVDRVAMMYQDLTAGWTQHANPYNYNGHIANDMLSISVRY